MPPNSTGIRSQELLGTLRVKPDKLGVVEHSAADKGLQNRANAGKVMTNEGKTVVVIKTRLAELRRTARVPGLFSRKGPKFLQAALARSHVTSEHQRAQ